MNRLIGIALILLLAFCGCRSCKDISIQPTRQWENHYSSVEEFKAGTSDMRLDKGESVWVLSNSTLKRVLKNVEK